jgi:DNA-binding CsgD family transcriptional regulator/PAS domain-containing protein
MATGVVDAIYNALTDDVALSRLPVSLAGALGGDAASIRMVHRDQSISPLYRYVPPSMMGHAAFGSLDAEFEWIRAALRNGEINRAISVRTHDDDGSSQTHGLGAVLPTQGGLMTLGIQWNASGGAFYPGAITTLDGLMPHLRRLAEGRSLLDRSRRRAEAAEALIDSMAAPIIETDANGLILFLNAEAQEVLAANDGLMIRAGTLTAMASMDARALSQAFQSAAAGGGAGGGVLQIERARSDKPWRVTVTTHQPHPGSPARALVMIADPGRQSGGLADTARSLFGLTASEGDLAMRLLNGQSPDEAARDRKVSIGTVRTQIKSIMAKTGARRQAELVLILARVPRLRRWSAAD